MLGTVRTLGKGGLATVCHRLKSTTVTQQVKPLTLRLVQTTKLGVDRQKSTTASHLDGSQQHATDTQTGAKQFSTSVSVKYTDEDDVSSDIIEKIDSQLATGEVGRMFAVIHAAGKQRKITTDDIVVLDKHIAADIGERIRFNKVMLVGSKDFSLVGRPILNAGVACVEGTVIEKTLSHTDVIFHYRKRDNHKHLKCEFMHV
ncbi:hypothetical protein NP493_306g00034 [Ridgeia piscesae]|uniref:Large ribosomal subunit protein bL21m n=1 Tax=Ridgeia piscesae TaxID=27915 RepID=A0AAD9NW48_RIDPI|nr:hypothetical protein NP493_306g00034 [Ridgeia piscesae]